MQSKGFIKLIAVLLALACVYQLSFTFKTRGVEKQAAAYAAQFPLDQQGEAEQHYLDSVQNLPVYNLGFRKFTYKECKEKELNLGLDLKGGMNVMLEVQVEDVVKALAGDSQNDPAFIEAIGVANEAMKQGSSTDYISDFVKAYSRLSNGRPIAELFVSPDRKDITLESSDADVEKILKKETEAAIGASFNVLRSRIDHFGVTQPNILRLPNSHRILVELPGVKEPQRVRDLLQGTASLEFWTTYDANEIFPALSAADKLIKAELAQAPAAAPETAAAEAAVAAGTPAAPQAARRDADDDPFVELGPDGMPIVPEAPQAAEAVASDDDGEFTEVDLSRPEGRLVIGPSGLVELERPAVRPAAGTAVRPAAPVSDEPFTELSLGGEDPVGTPAPAAEMPSVAGMPSAAAPVSGEPLPDGPFTEIPVPAGGVVVTVEANEARLVDEKAIPTESYDPLKDLVNYHKPPVTLLEDYVSDSEVSDEEIFENKTKIEDTLRNFGIPIQRIKATVGPTVTLYEIVQAQGVKISKIQGLENDIAQSLKALGIRIIAPIPGKGTIGIEVPNRDKQVVSMYSAVRSLRFQESKAELPVVIGRTIQNENYVFDLAKMPHLLVAGATGQGKSVGLNAIITSLLYRKHPAQLKFVMIDPKMVEFSLYAKIERHFLAKMESEDDAIITDPKKAVYTLNSLCTEMDSRLELCKKAGARNIAEYNEKFTARRLSPLNGHRYLPYIVVVVDEFADLIMTAREVEGPVMRLAQKARAVGIHLIIATQRPDVKVITGGIKANFPARIAFRVMQMIDSRTIIDQPGANQLIGRGDMLFSKDGELTRIQCALVETKEVERIVEYISKQQGYTSAYSLPDYTPDTGDSSGSMGSEDSAPVKYDSLFAEIARDAVSGGNISTSMIQRNYEVGFNRAGRIMMQLERAGIVGRQQGAKPRDILFHDMPSLEAKLQELGLF